MTKTLRILFTGGGTGGHIFPLVAVIEEIYRVSFEKGLTLKMKYIGPKSAWVNEFIKRGVKVEPILGAKIRRYFSVANLLDFIKFPLSLLQALFKLLLFMPDIVFSKGGETSFAVVLAAKFYRIPVFIHESDAIPGLANTWASKFAEKIFISFKRASRYFPQSKIELVGNPIRRSLISDIPDQATAKKMLNIPPEQPLILFLGGSQGASKINSFVVSNLVEILNVGYVTHQTGQDHIQLIKNETEQILSKQSEFYKQRYRAVGFLTVDNLKLNLAAADLVVSRAGSGAIFEIAAFSKPSILIPLSSSARNHQQLNALDYAETGAAIVITEANLKQSIFLTQVNKILNTPLKQKMIQSAKGFSKPDSAKIIAECILAYINP